MSNGFMGGTSGAEFIIIQSIEPVPEVPSNLRVSFQGHLSIEVAIRTWSDLNLRVGQQVTLEQLKEIGERSEIDHGVESAVRYLRLRARTSYEINAYLLKQGLSDSLRQDVIARLVERGLVNDGAYAREFIAREMPRRSRKEIAFRLKQRGIHVSDVLDDDSHEQSLTAELNSATGVADKYWRSHSRVEPHVRLRRLAMYMQRRGYPHTIIRQVLNTFTKDSRHSEDPGLHP